MSIEFKEYVCTRTEKRVLRYRTRARDKMEAERLFRKQECLVDSKEVTEYTYGPVTEVGPGND